jgi:hypothetical protein
MRGKKKMKEGYAVHNTHIIHQNSSARSPIILRKAQQLVGEVRILNPKTHNNKVKMNEEL